MPPTVDDATELEEVSPEPELEIEPEPATPQPAMTNVQPQFDDTSLKLAKRRMGFCGGAIGLGSVAVVLSYFVGSSSCSAQNGKCTEGRIAGLVLGGTAIIGGLLGMIPTGIALRREKKSRDQRVAFDPERGALVF